MLTSSKSDPPDGKTTSESEIFTGVYGGAYQDEAVAVVPQAGGGYLVAGNTRSAGAGGFDIVLLRLDRFGNCTLQRTLGGALDDRVRGFSATSDGGFVILGETSSFGKGRGGHLGGEAERHAGDRVGAGLRGERHGHPRGDRGAGRRDLPRRGIDEVLREGEVRHVAPEAERPGCPRVGGDPG